MLDETDSTILLFYDLYPLTFIMLQVVTIIRRLVSPEQL